MNRITHKKNRICRKIFPANSICVLRFIFLFFSLSSYASVATDTVKQQYALNDPRNPDCPCHKYQKMAEDEYKKLHHETNTNKTDQIGNTSNSLTKNSQKNVDRINKKSEIFFNRSKR
jgi:hypothetical protein